MPTTFPANTEMLLMLAWLAREPRLHEALIGGKDAEEVRQRRRNAETILTHLLDEEVGQVSQDAIYGPVYQRLLRHRLAHVEAFVVAWALRGEYGVCFREGYVPSHPEAALQEEVQRSETAVLWEAILYNERLFARFTQMSGQWQGNIRLGAQILWQHFRLHTPLLIRSTSCTFLVQELLLLSLEQVDWGEIAAKLVGVPYVPGSIQTEDIQEKEVLLATLKEVIWQGYHLFGGEFAQEDAFSEPLQELRLDLAGQCHQIHTEIRALEDSGSVYAN